jgi:dynein heavy chain
MAAIIVFAFSQLNLIQILCLKLFPDVNTTAGVKDKNQLVESSPGETFSRLPAIHLIPKTPPPGKSAQHGEGEKEGRQTPGTYQCPLYKTSARAGILSTTGQSTNFILHMVLPCSHDVDPASFVLSGTAALCELSQESEDDA